MNPDESTPFDSVVTAAEHMLSDVFGNPIRFTDVERISEPGRRNLLLRCRSAATRELPASYIIKKIESDSYNPEDLEAPDSQRFFRDWLGSRFLSDMGAGAHSPRFYGGNRELGFIIIEDLGPHRSLVEPLLHEDAASAEKALLRYSTRLGKIHAATVNKLDVFETLCHTTNVPVTLFTPQNPPLEQRIQRVQSTLADLGVSTGTTLPQELAAIVDAVANPGPFLAYIQADPCPDNVFDTDEHLRLIDFEFGHFGHALIDATYGRMIFPTCWCANRLPPAMVEQMESHYRAELSRGCPEAQEDEIFERALVTISGFWLLNTLGRHLDPALEEDRGWGLASLRQRILVRLEAFEYTSEQFGYLPELRELARRLLALLSNRWSEVPPLPVYPAFEGA